jgi:hypothetical protein
MVGRVADPIVSAAYGLGAADLSLHSVVLSIHSGGGSEVRFVERIVDGFPADPSLSPVSTWRARPGAVKKEVIYE